jgi:fucose permease
VVLGGGCLHVTCAAPGDRRTLAVVKTLTYVMFAMFAMTTDSVGIIIPEVIRTFDLSLTAAGSFQYATMGGIAVAALLLGHLADRIGRRYTIIAGLTLFAVACYLFAAGDSFLFFAILMGLSGIAIGIFKTGALALIGDLSSSTTQHTSIMNMLEGFFGIGAIIGPAILTRLLAGGLSWIWLYVLAGTICTILIVMASLVRYPEAGRRTGGNGAGGTARAMKNPYVLAFSMGAFLYVGVEAAVYVWMPTLLAGYTGSAAALATYAVSVFFLLRAAGRFLGVWMLTRFQWQAVLALSSGSILLCFLLAVIGGVNWAVYLLPLSGLFMSVMYPTINSKGISCLPKAEHGAGAGVILFFTCVSAVFAPLAMGAVSDALGQITYGFWLATVFAGLLFAGMLLNWFVNPTRAVLERLDRTEYRPAHPGENAGAL